MAWRKKTSICPHCGNITRAYIGICRYCQSDISRGLEYAHQHNLLIDKAGGAWWSWDSKGNVLAGPADNSDEIFIELGTKYGAR